MYCKPLQGHQKQKWETTSLSQDDEIADEMEELFKSQEEKLTPGHWKSSCITNSRNRI